MSRDEADSWLVGQAKRIDFGRLAEIEDTPSEQPQNVKVTDEELRKIKALGNCTFLPASFQKRFVRDMQSRKLGDELTWKQFKYINRLFWMYRRQHGLTVKREE
jgi:hypothetical protein